MRPSDRLCLPVTSGFFVRGLSKLRLSTDFNVTPDVVTSTVNKRLDDHTHDRISIDDEAL
jgi:hypothetical protein